MIWFLIVPFALLMVFSVVAIVGNSYDILRHDPDRGLLVFAFVLLASMLVGITFTT